MHGSRVLALHNSPPSFRLTFLQAEFFYVGYDVFCGFRLLVYRYLLMREAKAAQASFRCCMQDSIAHRIFAQSAYRRKYDSERL